MEAIEVSLYLVGITAFTGRADAFGARLVCRSARDRGRAPRVARFAASQLGAPTAPPNNLGFEAFPYKTTDDVRNALMALGIGYGTPSSAPGAFYAYPGYPVANGVGTPVDSPTPE